MARKSYLVGIIGEAEHQPAIEKCVIGERVDIPLERQTAGNAEVLPVVSVREEILGYIPRNGWLGRLIQRKGQACDAIIMSIKSPSPGMPLGVALSVQLAKDPPPTLEDKGGTVASRLWGCMRRSPVGHRLN
jgi:hypothetical protein